MEKPYIPSLPKVGPAQFVKEVTTELKKVTWPTREETLRLTAAVIGISVAVGAFIGGIDIILVKATSLIFGK